MASNICRALRWGYECSNRNHTCYTITSKRFSSTLFGGATASESCDAAFGSGSGSSSTRSPLHVFDSTSCDAGYRCFEDWEVCARAGSSFTLPSYGALAGRGLHSSDILLNLSRFCH